MKASEAEKLIGQKVQWEVTLCRNRGTYKTHSGTLEQVQGRNVVINGNWYWLPDLENFQKKP